MWFVCWQPWAAAGSAGLRPQQRCISLLHTQDSERRWTQGNALYYFLSSIFVQFQLCQTLSDSFTYALISGAASAKHHYYYSSSFVIFPAKYLAHNSPHTMCHRHERQFKSCLLLRCVLIYAYAQWYCILQL